MIRKIPAHYLTTVNKTLPYDIYKEWFNKRDQVPPPDVCLPALGGYIEIHGVPVAAGFLRLCEGNYAMIDSVATNPDARPHDRNEALDYLVEMLLCEAYKLEISVILAFTVDENTMARALRYGFAQLPHKTIQKTLRRGSDSWVS